MDPFVMIPGIIAGFCVATLLAGRTEGEQGLLKSIRFGVKDYTLHLHHWFMASIALSVLFFVDYQNDAVYGGLLGLVIQGLRYRDYYRILFRQ